MTAHTDEFGQPIAPGLPDWTAPPVPPQQNLQGFCCRVELPDLDAHLTDLYAAVSLDKTGANWTNLACGPFATIGAYHTWMETICLGTESIFSAIAAATQRRVGGVAGDLHGRNCDTAWFATIDAAWPAPRTAFAPWLAPDNFDNHGRQRTRLTDLTRPIRDKNAAQM